MKVVLWTNAKKREVVARYKIHEVLPGPESILFVDITVVDDGDDIVIPRLYVRNFETTEGEETIVNYVEGFAYRIESTDSHEKWSTAEGDIAAGISPEETEE